MIATGIILLIGVGMAAGTELKDVRIGEYEDFTRVVFEFSAAVKPQNFNDRTSGKLSVDFPDTQPQLIRKIPIDRSARIDNTLLWQKGTLLSAVIQFPFNDFRFDFFTLTEPDRIAIDIFPLSKASTAPATLQEKLPVKLFDDSPTTDTTSPDKATNGFLSPPETKQMEMAKPPPIRETPLETGSVGDSSPTPPARPPIPQAESKSLPTLVRHADESNGNHLSSSTSFTSRLQYYLVVGLVVITIAILGLLVLMLLSRHRLKNDAVPLSTDEYLKRQDQTIASLNARIQEQLRRYDDA